MPDINMIPEHAERIRSYLLAHSPDAVVSRELWSCSAGTYSSFREVIRARKQQQLHLQAAAAGSPAGGGLLGAPGRLPRAAASPHSLPATVKYSFEGVKHVLAEAAGAVTAVSFAALRSDLLAFGCSDGEIWRVALPPAAAGPAAQPTCIKARKMHGRAVQAVDWAYDNSQLLSVGLDGSLCVWDATDPALPCIRSIYMPTTAFLCGRFHRVNFSLALVGTSGGTVEVYNCSNGILHSRYQVAQAGSGVQVTALDSSNHHVFLGDSAGTLHLFACEMQQRQLSRLRPTGRLRLPLPGHPPAPVTALQYLPFCRATDSPVLMVALQDGSLCIVRANETRHTAELHLRRFIPPPSAASAVVSPLVSQASSASSTSSLPPPSPTSPTSTSSSSAPSWLRLRPSVCPLSVIHDVPLITYGSDDTSVYIVDVTARSFSTGAGGGAGGGGGGRGSVAGAAAAVDRPLTVTVLKAHRAPVTAVAWSFDESLLASADAVGTLVLWQRCLLF
ncbi:hypothetical protein Agub_g3202 [Astrephomene gubernaculifera]|uniref:Uncharacterized protein n=1 Tax=Astrephomene gubernaculifera TaxID=47775 RepID=A0AAD3DKA0_9CHLO|nr:hypothetical protein Agub_g3202 [Astrephomene gubernaculifera]